MLAPHGSRLRRTFVCGASLVVGLACSSGDGDDTAPLDPVTPAQGGGSVAGTGGGAQSGSTSTTGGSGGSGGTVGSAGSGGGGNMSGSGGSTTGGMGGVGATSGSDATGGAVGGTSGDAGSGLGGAGSGGADAGAGGSGGAATGGSSQGGAGTGGAVAGSAGQAQSGGTGGAAGGGGSAGKGVDGGSGGSTPGLGPWTDGYVATMYGNIDSGDCVTYSGSFTDHTPISTYTCVLGTGPRKVSLASYSQGVANNASYYAALGDLSSLWSANGNASPCTCNGSTSMTCGGPQCPSEISTTGSCGLCIAVKCDPTSTFKDNQGYSHNSSCNSTTYVVVQNIDACPHNHTTNVASGAGWCTDRQAQHIDLSCSGLGDISNLGTNVGQAGWLPVSVQVVDCSVGLGKHSL